MIGATSNEVAFFVCGDYPRLPEETAMKTDDLTEEASNAIEAATFRRLLQHLDAHKEVQNIDLMDLAGFCRNCLAKWYRAAADERGVVVSDADARERVYGIPYPEWKARHQTEKPADATAPASASPDAKR